MEKIQTNRFEEHNKVIETKPVRLQPFKQLRKPLVPRVVSELIKHD